MLQQRIEELEVRVAYQEQTIDELNQALVQQEMALQKLERAMTELLRRVDSLRAVSDSGPLPSAQDEVPPHY